MKKILTIAASLAIVAGLASCQKENVGENSGNSEQVTITATFADQTKVAYAESGNDLQPAWEVGDTIVGICGDEPFELKVKSISGVVATLEANVDSSIPEGDVTLFYKSGLKKTDWDSDNEQFVVSLNSQKGDKTMPAIMCATGTIAGASGNFMFENSGAVLGIYEVGSGQNSKTIKQVTLYGTNLASSANLTSSGVSYINPLGTYNVISTEILSGIPVGTDGKGTLSSPILMAVPAGAKVDSVFIRTTEGKVYSLGSTNNDAIAANDYRYIKGATFERDAKRDDMILTGVFSVQNGEEEPVKQVFFSKGNLQATYNSSASTYTWGFAANQYDCIGDAAGNTTIGSQTNGAVVDLFGWVGVSSTTFTSSPKIYGVSASTTSTDYGYEKVDTLKADWGTAIDDKGTWRTLSIGEWNNLFNRNTRTAMIGVTIGDTNYSGVFIYPDNYNGDDVSSMTWDQINAAGIVYLPAADHREGSSVTEVDENSRYWSSTVDGKTTAYHLRIESGGDVYTDPFSRAYGCSVRLITECQ